MKKLMAIILSCFLLLLAACGNTDTPTNSPSESDDSVNDTATPEGEEVTIQFAQWWEPELPDGYFKGLMEQFEEENPGIKVELISNGYAGTRDILVTGAATDTMPDVFGVDGVWIYDWAASGDFADLNALAENSGFDTSVIASATYYEDSMTTVNIANFVYPLFINWDIFDELGITEAPQTLQELVDTAIYVAENSDYAGFILPLQAENYGCAGNDIVSFVNASGDTVYGEDSMPNVENNSTLKAVFEAFKQMYDADALASGSMSMVDQDKVEEFANGRVAMMIGTLAWVNTIKNSSPDMNLVISGQPVLESYTGTHGMMYASWGIGIAANSPNQEAAWKLVEFLMREDINAGLCNNANALPGNKNAQPDFVSTDVCFEQAYEIFQESELKSDFSGMKGAEACQGIMLEELQYYLLGDISIDECLSNIQAGWEEQWA